MKILSFFCLFILMFVHGQTQTLSPKTVIDKKITGNCKEDINKLLPDGEFTADIMTDLKMSPRREYLMQKFMQAVQENREWFMQQLKAIEETNEGIQYDPRLGMTETEWDEYKKLNDDRNDLVVSSSGSIKLKIKKNKGIITFNTYEELPYLDSINIDTNNNTITIFDHVLTIVDTFHIADSAHVFKSAYHGYKWEYSEPENAIQPTTSEELSKFSMKLYVVLIGFFEKTGKTLIEISGGEIKDGKQLSNYKTPIVF